jgi:hypothetical protein
MLVKKRLAGKRIDNSLCHTGGKYMVLATGLTLLVCLLAAQVTLPRFAMGNFTRSSDLKPFGDSFVRLSHDQNFAKR